MYKYPEEIYKTLYPNYKYDNDLYTKLKVYRIGWTQKNDITLEWLSSNLTGVYPVRFSEQDEMLLYDVLEMDKQTLQPEIYDLRGLSRTMRTVTNATYFTLMYVAHKFATNRSFSQDVRIDAIKECYFIFIYKITCSLTAHYFKNNIDISKAKAINERMTNKFLIKKLGSWQAVFDYKAQDLLPGQIHWKRLLRFNTDDVVRIISDLDTKIRDVFKNNFGVLVNVNKHNERVTDTSLIETNAEDGDGLKAVTGRQDVVLTRVKNKLVSKVDFVDYNLIELLAKLLRLDNVNQVTSCILYLTEVDIKELDKYVELLLANSFSYLSTKGIVTNFQDRLYEVITILIGYWKSSNSKEKINKDIKNVFYDYAQEKLKSRNHSLILNVSVAMIVYVVAIGVI